MNRNSVLIELWKLDVVEKFLLGTGYFFQNRYQ